MKLQGHRIDAEIPSGQILLKGAKTDAWILPRGCIDLPAGGGQVEKHLIDLKLNRTKGLMDMAEAHPPTVPLGLIQQGGCKPAGSRGTAIKGGGPQILYDKIKVEDPKPGIPMQSVTEKIADGSSHQRQAEQPQATDQSAAQRQRQRQLVEDDHGFQRSCT